MRKAGVVLAVACGLGVLGPHQAVEAKTPRLKLTISNLRFCQADTCSPLDTGYVRTSSGPVMSSDNAQAIKEVRSGAVVTWEYRDSSDCEAIGCPGHNVVFENGTVQGARKGFVPVGQGPKKIYVKITQKAGTTIRYFCAVNNHYEYGMTGILRVV